MRGAQAGHVAKLIIYDFLVASVGGTMSTTHCSGAQDLELNQAFHQP